MPCFSPQGFPKGRGRGSATEWTTGCATGENVHGVFFATRNVKFVPVGIPCEAVESARHLQNLHLAGRAAGDIENENVFGGRGGDGASLRVVNDVVAAG